MTFIAVYFAEYLWLISLLEQGINYLDYVMSLASIIIDHVRSAREGNVFIRVGDSVRGGG